MEKKFIINIKCEDNKDEINMEISANDETSAIVEAWKVMKTTDKTVSIMTAQPVYAITLTTNSGLRREVVPADSKFDAVCKLAKQGFNTNEIWSIDQVDAEIAKLSAEVDHMRNFVTETNPLTGKLLTKRNPGDVWTEEINGVPHRMECMRNGYICQTRL